MRKRIRDNLIDFSFLLPALLFFTLMVLLPIFQGIPISMLKWDGFSKNSEFVGLLNYINIFRDPSIPGAFKNTITFAVLSVILSNGLGLLIAMLLKESTRLNNVARTIIFMPYVISLVLSAFIWSYIYSDIFYRMLGIPSPLGIPSVVILGLVIICVWRDSGYCMVIYLAAIQTISPDYYEVAVIEGASPWQKFKFITLPMIVPAITANVTLTLSWGLKMFDYAMAATGGGPGRASETVNMLVYNNIFVFFKAGYGQALAILFAVFIFIVTNLMNRVLRKREVEL